MSRHFSSSINPLLGKNRTTVSASEAAGERIIVSATEVLA